jgi:cysteine desulfurase
MIFLDNASTTELKREARNMMEKSYDLFYNPSAVYNVGLEIKNKIIETKKVICDALGTAYNDNLIFTGSATEANNLAIFGSIKTGSMKKEQLIFGQGEHPSVYNCAQELKARGYDVKFLPLMQDGVVDLDKLKEFLDQPTAFVSIMHVSNETGSINDIAKIAKMIRQKHPDCIFHCDGVQAFGKIPVNLTNLGVDLYTISSHKLGGPKGIGALYAKNPKKLKPIVFGGEQEYGLRSGTENTSYILAFGEVVKNLNIDKDFEKVKKLNEFTRKFFDNASRKLSVKLNSPQSASPYILSYSFDGVRGETLVHILEDQGVIIGTGSACSSKKSALNRTLEAMGLSKSQNEGAVRISFSPRNNLNEVRTACKLILKSYEELIQKLK